MRLDELLVGRGLYASRSRARDAIERGAVRGRWRGRRARPARPSPPSSDIRDRRSGRQLRLARGAEADRRARPFRPRPGRQQGARHRRLDRRLHAGAAGARRRACDRHRCRARPDAIRRSQPIRASPASKGSTRATLSQADLGGKTPGFPRLRRQLHFADACPAAGARSCRAGRERRVPGQAAIRGRPRGDRQGRHPARTPRTAPASPKSCGSGSTHCPAGGRSASARRRSRAATATANSCSPGSRTDDQPLRHRAARRAGRRRRRDRNRAGLRSLHAARRGRDRGAGQGPRRTDRDPGSRRRSGSSPPAGISAHAAAARSSIWSRAPIAPGSATRWCRRCADAAASTPSPRDRPLRAAHAPARDVQRPQDRRRHAARLQPAPVQRHRRHRRMPDLCCRRSSPRSRRCARLPG